MCTSVSACSAGKENNPPEAYCKDQTLVVWPRLKHRSEDPLTAFAVIVNISASQKSDGFRHLLGFVSFCSVRPMLSKGRGE